MIPPRSDQARWFSDEVQPHEPVLRFYLRAKFSAHLDIHEPSEPIRRGAAQGCTILGPRAAPAAPAAALRRRLTDPSGGAQVAVAEALAAISQTEAALPALAQSLQNATAPAVIMLAGDVIDRIGEGARPLLPAMKSAIAAAPTTPNGTYPPQPILNHPIAVLEGTTAALVWPTTTHLSHP